MKTVEIHVYVFSSLIFRLEYFLNLCLCILLTGLQDYLIKQQNYLSQKETDFKATSESLKQCIKRIDELQDSIVLFESDCRNKGIDPKDCSNHAEEFVLALQGKNSYFEILKFTIFRLYVADSFGIILDFLDFRCRLLL